MTQGKRGIWLRVPAEKAGLVGAAVGMGFTFHHAEGHPNHYVMLTKWLPQDENKLPANASHQVSCECLCEEGKQNLYPRLLTWKAIPYFAVCSISFASHKASFISAAMLARWVLAHLF